MPGDDTWQKQAGGGLAQDWHFLTRALFSNDAFSIRQACGSMAKNSAETSKKEA
jgi:hypothetical protein